VSDVCRFEVKDQPSIEQQLPEIEPKRLNYGIITFKYIWRVCFNVIII